MKYIKKIYNYMLILYQETFFFLLFLKKNRSIKTYSSSKMYHPRPLGLHFPCSFSLHEALFLERKTPALGAVPISWLDFIKYSRALWKGSRGSASGCGSQNLSCMRIQNSNFSLRCCKPRGALAVPVCLNWEYTALVFIYIIFRAVKSINRIQTFVFT